MIVWKETNYAIRHDLDAKTNVIMNIIGGKEDCEVSLQRCTSEMRSFAAFFTFFVIYKTPRKWQQGTLRYVANLVCGFNVEKRLQGVYTLCGVWRKPLTTILKCIA